VSYKIGSMNEFMQWTKEVVRDPTSASGTPKRWYDSANTARKASRRAVGAQRAEALVKLLSEQNRALLHLIMNRRPGSVRELAALSHRKESNLSRTLKKLEEAGIIGFEAGAGRTRAPRLLASRVTLDFDLVGRNSAVSVR